MSGPKICVCVNSRHRDRRRRSVGTICLRLPGSKEAKAKVAAVYIAKETGRVSSLHSQRRMTVLSSVRYKATRRGQVFRRSQ